jgi:hypothetical protein
MHVEIGEHGHYDITPIRIPNPDIMLEYRHGVAGRPHRK